MATPTSLPASFSAGAVLTAAQMNNLRGAFRVLQVVSTVKTDTFSSTTGANNYVNVTGLSATITPSSTSSKILILAQVSGSGGVTTVNGFQARLTGGNSGNYVGDAAGSRTRGVAQEAVASGDQNRVFQINMMYLDSPATTSATTYQVTVSAIGASDTVYVNRSVTDTDSNMFMRAASSITVMEISA